jgi:acyl-coenzyme A synthetase/AMP-(fatty) acid ligase
MCSNSPCNDLGGPSDCGGCSQGATTRIRSLCAYLGGPSDCAACYLWSAHGSVALSDVLTGTSLGGGRSELSRRSILLRTDDSVAAALAMLELDGIARRLVICPPDVPSQHLPALIAKAGVDAIVSDRDLQQAGPSGVIPCFRASCTLSRCDALDLDPCATEWVLLTSGTTGVPKMLVHNLAALTGAIKGGRFDAPDVVWGTFYDIRRYGGLQIFLRAIIGRKPLVLPGAGESPTDHLLRLGARGVTHLTGTPTHWRRALMNTAVRAIAPRYIRLSGEIADQAILNALRSFFPKAIIGHAYASTEAGVSFEVNDGLEGFPSDLIGKKGEVEIKVQDGSLRIRSIRTASRYLGEDESPLVDPDGFVDTADMVEKRGDRYYFLGRRSGVINVGGLKVYPEEVEVLINRHPSVLMSCVRSRRNPITGALVVADVVLKKQESTTNEKAKKLEQEILNICRETLPRHKVPAALRFVADLAVAETGKMGRSNA